MSTAADRALPGEPPATWRSSPGYGMRCSTPATWTRSPSWCTSFTNFDRIVDGPQFLGELIGAQRAAFSDMRFETLQTLAAGDWVITKMRWTGTFRAGFGFIGLAGIKPTGRAFDVEHVHAFRLAGGKIAEHWAIRDDLTMHGQLLGRRAA